MFTCLHAQSCLTLCDPKDFSPSGTCVLGIFQARILEQVAISDFKGSLWPRDWTCLSSVSCIGRWILYHLGSPNNVYRNTKILLHAGNFWLDVSNKKLKRCKLGTNLYCIWAISVCLYVIPNIASYWAWLQDLTILWQQLALTKGISFLFMSNKTECLSQ